MLNSFKDVIDKFGGAVAFGHAVGMKPNTAKQARKRDSLSPRWFTATAQAAKERGLEIDERTLSVIAETRRGG